MVPDSVTVVASPLGVTVVLVSGVGLVEGASELDSVGLLVADSVVGLLVADSVDG